MVRMYLDSASSLIENAVFCGLFEDQLAVDHFVDDSLLDSSCSANSGVSCGPYWRSCWA